MVKIQNIVLALLLSSLCQTAFAESFLKKNDLLGKWNLKSTTCSKGKLLAEIKNAKLNYTGKHLSLILEGKNSKKETAIDTDQFVIQEDLLTFSKSQTESATVKVQKKTETTMEFKFPVFAGSANCSDEELAVWTFQREK